ncbi:hypothetical protein DFH08DRAFT_846458 [Mycena albidolilacea]|uniref:Uncharacterized protein n=1 Tax=Mycena albidolilacea TaxID=1033008 RepID=A0AAD7AJG3_9AGAR|nr:hypothetical protein DFH08DRAFT_846458 [Mycena albidolilacea]
MLYSYAPISKRRKPLLSRVRTDPPQQPRSINHSFIGWTQTSECLPPTKMYPSPSISISFRRHEYPRARGFLRWPVLRNEGMRRDLLLHVTVRSNPLTRGELSVCKCRPAFGRTLTSIATPLHHPPTVGSRSSLCPVSKTAPIFSNAGDDQTWQGRGSTFAFHGSKKRKRQDICRIWQPGVKTLRSPEFWTASRLNYYIWLASVVKTLTIDGDFDSLQRGSNKLQVIR